MGRRRKKKDQQAVLVHTPVLMVMVAEKGHAKLLAEVMRQKDVEEVWASGNYTPLEACERAIEVSAYAWAAYLRGELAALFGIMCAKSEIEGEFAIPWVLTGTAVDKYPCAFWRASKDMIKMFQPRFRRMINMIDLRYTSALVWARRLGFKVYDPVPFGKMNMPFCRVEMRSDN